MVGEQLAGSMESVCDRSGAAAFGGHIRRVAGLLRLDRCRRSSPRRRPRRDGPGDRGLHGHPRRRAPGELDRRRRPDRVERIRRQQADAAEPPSRHRRRARRRQGHHLAPARRAGTSGQGHRQQHRPAGQGHELRADPAHRRGRHQRIGARRRRDDPGRDAWPLPGDRCPRADDDAAAAGQPRRRDSRAGTAHLDDHPGGHRAVDAVRDESGARGRLGGCREAAGRDGQADGHDVRPGRPTGQQPRADAVVAGHQ